MATREGGVVAGLVRSSSRVADLNSLQEQQQQQQQQSGDKEPEYFDWSDKTKKKKKKKQFMLASCFNPQSGHPQQHRTSRHKGLWPSSPSHIMSRLLFDIGGDQSPAHQRGASGRARRSSSYARPDFFSGPLAASSSKRDEASDEPVSPKVTCMGTVKVPKHCKAGRSSKPSPPRPLRAAPLPPSNWTKTKPRGGDGDGGIDLSRFGGTCSLAPPDEVMMADTRRDPISSPSSPPSWCKKADEVCIWKRRCISEPLKLKV